MAKRLLIVDDEETLTYSLCQSFIMLNKDYEVVPANSGEDALHKLSEKPFDLIITDIFLPGINGFDVLRKVRDDFPETDVVIMTAYGSGDIRERALTEGARYYIEKPFEIRDFKKVVINILG